jgi:outer membrane immunogenic protein
MISVLAHLMGEFLMKKWGLGLLGLTLTSVVAVASANAADMYRAPEPVVGGYKDGPVLYNWSGFYVGIQGGGAWGDSIQTFNAGVGAIGSTRRFDISGGEGGGTLGYNWQGIWNPHLVLGIEADFSGSNIKGNTVSTATYGCGTGCSTNVESFGTVRGRLGYAWNNVLLYGTGGLAYGNIESTLNGGKVTNWQTGWTAGAGAEYGFARNWSAKLEWNYVNFDSFQWTNANNGNTFACAGIHCSTDAKFSVVRAGINYHIGSVYEPLK